MQSIRGDGRRNDDALSPSTGGFPATVAAGRFVSTGAPVASIAAVTSPQDGLTHEYRVSVVITVTAYTSGTINAQVTYQDDNGTNRTVNIPLCADGGTYAAGANAVGQWKGSIPIRVNPNQAITLLTAGTFTANHQGSGLIEEYR